MFSAGLSAAVAIGGDGTTRVVRRPESPAPPGAAPAPPTQTAAPSPMAVWVRHKPAFTVHDVVPQAPAEAVALTIDDGPSALWTPRMLDLLDHHEIKATFCLIGTEARRFPHLVQRIVEAGHHIANHTMHHPLDFGTLSRGRLDAEILGAHKIIHETAGVWPRLFRAPGGAWSRQVYASVAAHGMIPIDWDVDPRDWSRPGVPHVTRMLLKAKPGDILLCHDGGGDRAQTLSSLKTVLPRLKDRGLQFITL